MHCTKNWEQVYIIYTLLVLSVAFLPVKWEGVYDIYIVTYDVHILVKYYTPLWLCSGFFVGVLSFGCLVVLFSLVVLFFLFPFFPVVGSFVSPSCFFPCPPPGHLGMLCYLTKICGSHAVIINVVPNLMQSGNKIIY